MGTRTRFKKNDPSSQSRAWVSGRGNEKKWANLILGLALLDLLKQSLHRSARDLALELRAKIADDAHIFNDHVVDAPLAVHFMEAVTDRRVGLAADHSRFDVGKAAIQRLFLKNHFLVTRGAHRA